MSAPLTIALDTMGGDKAPDIVLNGANIACERFPHVSFLLFGPEDILLPKLNKLKILSERSEICHTSEVITNQHTVSEAVRKGKNTSMWKAVEAVKNGRADSIVSAGNTGALMAVSKLVLKTIEGVHRPAIASFFPTVRGESVMLDLGANVDCDENNIVQFALMGNIFSKNVLGVLNPTLGILNVGSENHKGKEHLRAAAATLKKVEGLCFEGFIEGDDIAKGTVDVIVTDGFTGNIALKTAEGVGQLYVSFLSKSIRSSGLAKFGYLFCKGAFKKLRERLDPHRYNGAVFLGLNGVSVKSHGNASAFGFATAIGVAVHMASQNYTDELAVQISAVGASSKSRKAKTG